jgi:hypothetical protein
MQLKQNRCLQLSILVRSSFLTSSKQIEQVTSVWGEPSGVEEEEAEEEALGEGEEADFDLGLKAFFEDEPVVVLFLLPFLGAMTTANMRVI